MTSFRSERVITPHRSGSRPILQIAFLTGQSNPASCALSPAQSRFLATLDSSDRLLCETNFPYDNKTAPFRPTPLIVASVRNALQCVSARRTSFRRQHRAAVHALLARADHTVFLAGSCGLELLIRLNLPEDALRRISVFAYGPVSQLLPACETITVCGTRDMLSRLAHGRADHTVDAGHMDYLSRDAVVAICRVFVDRVHARLAQPATADSFSS